MEKRRKIKLNYWIFNVKDDKIDGVKKKGMEIYRQRMKDRFWGLKENVDNSGRLVKGDHVVYYLAGMEGPLLLGTAKLASEYFKLGKKEKKYLHGPFFQTKYGVKLEQINEWKTPQSIRPLIPELKFTKNKENWGAHLQGSVIKIPDEDYYYIIAFETEAKNILNLIHEEPKLTDENQSTHSNAKRRTRKFAFRTIVRQNYDNTCAVCEKQRYNNSRNPEVDAAHIYPKSKNGSDDPRNGLALCKSHHWAFDGGLFSIRDDYSIIIADRIKGDKNYNNISNFENETIKLPNKEAVRPHRIYLQKHREIHGF